jgi:transcriptional regulator with XRE-family HTH domain
LPSSRLPQIRLVGQKIRQIRKSRHLTQADLAAQIGVTQSDLSRMENGEYKVGLDTLFRILQIFELTMSQFFGEPVQLEAPSPAFPEDPETARDWEALTPEARREVREFIAFKKLQGEFRRSLKEASPQTPPLPATASPASEPPPRKAAPGLSEAEPLDSVEEDESEA